MFYTDLPVAELGVLFEQWHLGVCWEVPGEVSVPFLDLWLEFDSDGYLTHKLYKKPLNHSLYLPADSNHPEACLQGWIRTEKHQIEQRNTDRFQAKEDLKKFRSRLMNKGYSTDLINKAFAAAHRSRLPDFRRKVNLVLTFNRGMPRKANQKKLLEHI